MSVSIGIVGAFRASNRSPDSTFGCATFGGATPWGVVSDGGRETNDS